MRKYRLTLSLLILAIAAFYYSPLHSWNDGELKNATIAYVKKITNAGFADYTPPEHLVATFENRYSQGNKYRSFQLIVNHDGSTREFYYQEKSNASLVAAAQNKWYVVSMKNDWKKVFPD